MRARALQQLVAHGEGIDRGYRKQIAAAARADRRLKLLSDEEIAAETKMMLEELGLPEEAP